MYLLRHFVILCLFTFGCILWHFFPTIHKKTSRLEQPNIVFILADVRNETNHVEKPNIVFILADDLGWADVGYNNPYIITPNIDKLAKEGVILNQSYVAQTCGPTRAALMTGYYPYRLGFQVRGPSNTTPGGLPLSSKILPQTLKQMGYSTYMVGKWHLGFCNVEYTPTRRGFDSFYGYYVASEDHYNHSAIGALDLHDNLDPDWSQNGTYSSYLYSDKAVDFIESHDKAKPFFMYLAYQSVHSPNEVPQKYYDMYPSVKNEGRRTIMAMVTALDDGIGKVVRALQENGLRENTLIIFSSDNGAPVNVQHEGSNWPLLGVKQQLYEGGTRAVAFIHGDMLKKTGYTYNGMIHVVDWYPTIASIASGEVQDQDMDGINVWNALSTNSASPREEMVYNIMTDWDVAAIRIGDYKLMTGKNHHNACWTPPPEAEGKWGGESCFLQQKGDVYLFNLKDDPSERINLAEKLPDKVDLLMRRLEERSKKVIPGFQKDEFVLESLPSNFGGVWSHGWC
ncbi:arylsulfatase J-like [Ptychodera flava]|uniref:arylsulfatase J-like n=1 Tax=Ptychodera flava TaxID=63121 RepID=UPI00396A239A